MEGQGTFWEFCQSILITKPLLEKFRLIVEYSPSHMISQNLLYPCVLFPLPMDVKTWQNKNPLLPCMAKTCRKRQRNECDDRLWSNASIWDLALISTTQEELVQPSYFWMHTKTTVVSLCWSTPIRFLSQLSRFSGKSKRLTEISWKNPFHWHDYTIILKHSRCSKSMVWMVMKMPAKSEGALIRFTLRALKRSLTG